MYEVTGSGQVWDRPDHKIADTDTGDLFLWDGTFGPPPDLDDRRHGTLHYDTPDRVTGYVLAEKLEFVKSAKVCPD